MRELTGKSIDYTSICDETVCDIDGLQSLAERSKLSRLLHQIYIYQLLISFWQGDFLAAEKDSHKAWAMPKEPELILIYHTLFGGLTALRLYRHHGNDKRLKEGSEMMDRVRKYSYNSRAVFENKYLLLKAEYTASFHNSDGADKFYEGSIKAAQDHGNIHEVALAYHLFGDYHAARGSTADSQNCYNNAHIYYT